MLSIVVALLGLILIPKIKEKIDFFLNRLTHFWDERASRDRVLHVIGRWLSRDLENL